MDSRSGVKIRILTDVDISQSPLWCQETGLTENLYSSWIRRISKMLSGPPERYKHIFDTWIIIRNLLRYDAVITGNIKTAQIIGLIKKVLGFKSPIHIILELMLDEQEESIKWKFKREIQHFIFSAVDLIFVSSRSETVTYAERLHLPHQRFRFLPFHTDIMTPKRIMTHNDYILSAGKTGRDYEVLLRAVEGLDVKVIIVSDQYHVQGLRVPSNVKILVDISYEDYLKLLHESYFVVVPLRKLVKSTGQVVILEAMGLGKPVITTETVGTIDYIQHGVNGIMVPPGDSQALKDSIQNLISDKVLYESLAINGMDAVKKYHTFDAYVGAILKAANELHAKVG
ncbi:MAG TPA: glycosyltransferase family 4 protein [Syntrophorhabdus sp.]|nr:glycosyltransferase family 4 protein [Syntrophorhabdus sp.]